MLMPCLILLGCAAADQADRHAVAQQLAETVPSIVPLAANQGASHGSQPLNVSIIVFDSESEIDQSLYSAASRVRVVETRYFPVLLKRTLDETAYWGDVRVLPRADPGAEVVVQGSIIQSDGLTLHLHILVIDATGQVWLDQPYLATASEMDYAMDPSYLLDPFQNLYNQLANDMSQLLLTLAPSEQDRLLDTAMLKYALALSPETFGGYLATDDAGMTSLLSLPARSDTLFTRVKRLRQSEFLFADSVSEHYESLFRRLGETYAWWRHYSYELMAGNQALSRVDATRGATQGTWYAIDRVYHTYKEARMNEDALRELTMSFDQEATPLSTQIEGQVVELTGTADNQYVEWRRILSKIYQQETGLPTP